ncbi:MAG: NADPH-dependent 7-cyano-7-deazaguanine reductase QueF [Betaproteobacteria bacterium]|nr:NADPH-dependent 7-cyano-7-deazaguanine reductase QueF [Betaproteobacteria bacterium]
MPKKESTSTKRAKSLSNKGALAKLTQLGSTPTARPAKVLETFPNPNPDRDYLIHMQIPEFTCLCPKTGQPDFATLYLDYVPEKSCVELKSLKLYIWSFRDEGKFHEAVTNEILDDVVKAIAPRFARLTAKFWVRGGIFTTVVAEHRAKGWMGSMPAMNFGDESNVARRY